MGLEFKITHLKMLHKPPANTAFNKMNLPKNIKEEISYSQYFIAQHILKHPNAIVVSEGYSELYLSSSVKQKPRYQEISQHFSLESFNLDFSKLTEKQKELLAEYGGAWILLYLNLIPAIFPSQTKMLEQKIGTLLTYYQSEKSPRFFNHTARDILYSLDDEREKQALVFCIKALKDSKCNHVIMPYGAKHNFTGWQKLLLNYNVKIEQVDCYSQAFVESRQDVFKAEKKEVTIDPEILNKVSLFNQFNLQPIPATILHHPTILF